MAKNGRANRNHWLTRWLTERFRDLIMWPLNLVRDFPVRAGRLAQTLYGGLTGILLVLPEAIGAAGQGQFRSWWRQAAGRFAGWSHRLASQLFDLLGGPEITQFLAHLITNTTPLEEEELSIISSILGPSGMRYKDVRVAEGGLQELIFRWNGNLAYTTWHTIHFPRSGSGAAHSRANLAILVHELTHVYQHECVGSRYLGEAIYQLIVTKRKCYDYGYVPGLREAYINGKQYKEFNREQQAQIVQDYFVRQRKGADVTAYRPFMVQLRRGEV